MDRKVAMEEVKKTRGNKSQEATPRINTEALLVSELVQGMHYRCLLANDRKVQYIGSKKIKWHSEEADEYRTAEVHDYQLRPLATN